MLLVLTLERYNDILFEKSIQGVVMEVLYLFFAIVFVIVVIGLISAQTSKEHKFNEKKDYIKPGISVEDLIEEYGEPNKIIEIDKKTSLYVYTCDKWKGVLFGGSKHEEITLTISNGIVKSVSKE